MDDDKLNTIHILECNISNQNKINTTNSSSSINNKTNNILISTQQQITPSINNYMDNLNQSNSEKCDITPENSKKSDDIEIFSNNLINSNKMDTVKTTNFNNDNSKTTTKDGCCEDVQFISKSISLNEMTSANKNNKDNIDVLKIEEKVEDVQDQDDKSRPNALAFTIDFGDNKNSIDSQKRYKNMVERFQNRHKRGQSLSKLDNDSDKSENHNYSSESYCNSNIRPPMSAKLPRKKQSLGTTSESSFSSEQDEQFYGSKGGGNNVKLRERDKSVDRTKRHSWGPKTSIPTTNTNKEAKPIQNSSTKTDTATATNNNSNLTKLFTPRSTAMTLAFDSQQSKLDFLCPAPPLENNFKSNFKLDDDDSISEAGTYTLDGDNYTEEQKEKMNIDAKLQKAKNMEKLEIIDLDQQENDEKNENDSEKQANQQNRRNILEISFYHNESTNFKPKLSYLEKIKSRVKNMGSKSIKSGSPDKLLPSPDLGTFTSVTTSGILSIKPTLEHNPKLTRKNSLTKSQIDSSEYVQGISRLNLKCDDDQISDGTNVESNDEKELKILNSENVKLPTTIKTAPTKSDWIQEWAKYAREYAQNPNNKNIAPKSIDNKSNPNKLMSQSYDFENYYANKKDNNIENLSIMTKSSDYSSNYDDEFGHNLERNNYNYRFNNNNNNKLNKNNSNIERINNIGNYEYSSSDPNLKSYEPKHKQQQRTMIRPNDIRYETYNNQMNIEDESYRKWKHNQNNNNFNAKNNYYQNQYFTETLLSNNRPPMSPSKIPSPIHSLSKARGSSRNRSRNGSNTDLNCISNDTEMYLQKTAAAITTLQNIHRQNSLNNSPQSPSSPVNHQQLYQQHKKISPKVSPVHVIRPPIRIGPQSYPNDDEEPLFYKSLHQRNLSLDGTEVKPKLTNRNNSNYYERQHSGGISNSYNNSDGLNLILDLHNKTHSRHHSYEGMSQNIHFDQTNNEHLVAMRPNERINRPTSSNRTQPSTNSPIKRSNSFSVKNTNMQNYNAQSKMMVGSTNQNNSGNKYNQNLIKKSASSTSFRRMIGGLVHENDDEMEFYINDDDDLIDDHHYNNLNSSESDLSEGEPEVKEPITNTRYNKAFLMRMEQNKKPAGGSSNASGNSGNQNNKQGVIACPNTPEFRRRDTSNIRQSFRERASMPRDSSLSRMKQELPNLNSTKKSFSSSTKDTASSGGKVMPKYLDISKYKPSQGANFLKKDETKSYLVHKEVRRSPSATSVNLSRNDTTRTSNRSIKSAGAKPNSSTKKDLQLQKAKEAELAMWKRRANYDPMKAAAEGRKKQEEAKRQAQQSKLCESSVVLRSQSFHSGVTGGRNLMNLSKYGANEENEQNYYTNKRWTLTSNESSDEDEYT